MSSIFEVIVASLLIFLLILILWYYGGNTNKEKFDSFTESPKSECCCASPMAPIPDDCDPIYADYIPSNIRTSEGCLCLTKDQASFLDIENTPDCRFNKCLQ